MASGTMVGVMFSLAAYQGKSVSNSALMHAIWNFVMITSVLHITTAQGAYGSPLFQITIPPDNILVTGGGFGIEASFIALVGYVLVCAVLLIQAKPISSVPAGQSSRKREPHRPYWAVGFFLSCSVLCIAPTIRLE